MSPLCLKRLVPLVAAASLTVVSPAAPQTTAKPGIADGIQQIRSGDPFRAVLTLNDVIAQNAGDAGLVARAHAVSAMAHLAMNQPERARASALRALAVQASFVPNPEELNAATIALFDTLRGPAPANRKLRPRRRKRPVSFNKRFSRTSVRTRRCQRPRRERMTAGCANASFASCRSCRRHRSSRRTRGIARERPTNCSRQKRFSAVLPVRRHNAPRRSSRRRFGSHRGGRRRPSSSRAFFRSSDASRML